MGKERSKGWKRIRRMARARDCKAQEPCWICGKPIDYEAKHTDPMSYEADHVIPVAVDATKELDLKNIRASHKQCNRARGYREVFKPVGQRSREW